MYRLSDSLPYRLHRVGSRLTRLFTRQIADLGLTLPMYQALVSLAGRPDQRLNDLADVTGLLLPTTSRLVGTLAAMGLVSRERDPDHERAVQINLTPSGVEMAAELLRRAEHYEQVLVAALSGDEAERLRSMLDGIYATLDQLESELGA